MFTKSLIATTLAAAIAVGAATTASASSPDVYIDQTFGKNFTKDFMKDSKKTLNKKYHSETYPSWAFPGFFGANGFFFNFGGRKVCTPVYDDEWVWHPWKGWVLETVKVGEKCRPVGFNFGW
jgi:hypothetical protein